MVFPDILIIDGQRKVTLGKGHYRIYLGLNRRLYEFMIPGTDFRILAVLALARKRWEFIKDTETGKLQLSYSGGWISKSMLAYPDKNAVGYIWRMRKNLYRELPRTSKLKKWPIFENDKNSNYRILLDPGKIEINSGGIIDYGDFSLCEIIRELSPGLYELCRADNNPILML